MVIVLRESAAIVDSEVGAVPDLVGSGEPTGVDCCTGAEGRG